MVNATPNSPAALPPLAPPVLPPSAKGNKVSSFTPTTQTSAPVRAALPTPSAPVGQTGAAFRESPAIVKPNTVSTDKKVTSNSNSGAGGKKNPMRMAVVGAGLFVGILAISTGIWFIGQSQDNRQQAYYGQVGTASPTPAATFEPENLASPTPVLLALAGTKVCGQSCTSNNDCQSGYVCSSADNFRCVLSACLEGSATCNADKCSLTSTPLGGGAGIGGTASLSGTVATPIPTPTPTPISTRSSTVRTSQPASSQAVPVSGSAGTTAALIGSGLLFIVLGSWLFFRNQDNLDSY